MAKEKNIPTAAELEILNILWQKEPLSVKEIHVELIKKKEVGYTTALKIMQNMTNKGLLTRTLNGKSHLYSAAVKKDITQISLLNKFIDTAFSGSASNLVMQLLGNSKTSKKELEAIKKIIDEMEKNK